MTTNSPKQNTHAPQRRQHAEAGDTGWQMPNTGRAEAPTQRNHTIEEDKLHRSSRSPNTEKSNIRTRQNTRGEPKPQPTHTEQDKKHGAGRSPTTQKTQNTNHTGSTKTAQPEREKKKEKRREKTRKPRKAKESTGTKKGEKKRRRRPAGPGKKRKLKHGCMDQSQQWYR